MCTCKGKHDAKDLRAEARYLANAPRGSIKMNRDSLILTLVVLVVIIALVMAVIPTAERLKELLMNPGKGIHVEQVLKA